MLPNVKASYRARPMQWAVGESKNKAPQFAVEFALYEQWNGTEWAPCEFDITGYFYLLKKDGSINETTVAALEDAFGWNRTTGVKWLAQAGELPDCQVFCDYELYEGQQKMKVKWLNPFDKTPTGGVGSSDPQEVQSIDAKYGNLFRATARKTAAPSTTAPKANGNGTAVNPQAVAKREAWEAFKTANPGTQADQGEGFKRAVHDYFAGKPPESLGADQWRQFQKDGFRKLVESPIGEEQQFTEDDIPF